MSRNVSKSSDYLQIILPFITFFFGIIGGKLFEKILERYFANENNLMLIGIFTIGLLTVFSLILINIFGRNIKTMQDQTGIPAELIFERVYESKGIYFRKLADLIKQATPGDDILIMASYGNIDGGEDPTETEDYKNARAAYSKTLLEKSKEQDIKYHRVICFDRGAKDKIAVPYIKSWLEDHCSKMLEIKKEKPDKIFLKKSEATAPAGIVIIGKKIGTIDIDIPNPKIGQSTTRGILIFHNPPNSQIIEQLTKWFQEAESNGSAVSKIPESS